MVLLCCINEHCINGHYSILMHVKTLFVSINTRLTLIITALEFKKPFL
jgi:hypothetical protein